MDIITAPIETPVPISEGAWRINESVPWSRDFINSKRVLNDIILNAARTLESYGARGNGVDLDDNALASANAAGKPVIVRAGATYYFSVGISVNTGFRLICRDGIATIKLKTGAGGFNSVASTIGGSRMDTGNCMFAYSNVDDVGLENLHFVPDGTRQVTIYTVRVARGLGSIGFYGCNLTFEGFANGVMIGFNSVGAASYTLENIRGLEAISTLGNTHWTGGIQLTVVELDNDLVGGVYSDRGYISNLSCKNWLTTGAAYTDFGQQTDLFNHVGTGSDKLGPVISGISADGVGEVLDIFGQNCVVSGLSAKNVSIVCKFIHGSQNNSVDIDSVESASLAVAVLFGSDSTALDTKLNTIRIHSVRGIGTGAGATVVGWDPSVVVFGGGAMGLTKQNVIDIDTVLGNASMPYVVRDGTAGSANNNLVRVKRASAWLTAFCLCTPANTTVQYATGTNVALTIPGNQTITTATPTIIDFSTVVRDTNSEAVTGSDKVRCQFPGLKLVVASLKISGHAAAAAYLIEILQNGTLVASAEAVTLTTADQAIAVQGLVTIGEDQVSAAAGDISIRYTIVSAGTLVVKTGSAETFFVVKDI